MMPSFEYLAPQISDGLKQSFWLQISKNLNIKDLVLYQIFIMIMYSFYVITQRTERTEPNIIIKKKKGVIERRNRTSKEDH